MKDQPELDLKELTAKLKNVLETWPLYREFWYKGTAGHIAYDTGHQRGKKGQLPEEIELFCTRCAHMQRWKGSGSEVYFRNDSFHDAIFTCKNCTQERVKYFFVWSIDEQGGIFIKVGQYPPLEINPAPDLEKKLGPENTALYKKALICRNQSFGLAALGYLRRVVENQMNSLLDLIANAAKASAFLPEELAKLEEIKKTGRFEAKAEFAAKILPPYLRPGGHNPLGVLTSLPSEGLHGKSEAECIDIFDRVQLVFEYLFRNLSASSDEAAAYVQRLTELASKNSPD